jgi:hypothetical protein
MIAALERRVSVFQSENMKYRGTKISVGSCALLNTLFRGRAENP